MKIVFLSLLLVGWVSGVTKEVVRVFQPASYHDTDSAHEYGVKGDLVQAAVIDRPVVLSGAFPEDLVKAVGMPFEFASNNASYKVAEANLVVLCGLDIQATRENNAIKVVIDCTRFKIPELVELTGQQILTMTVESIRRTVRVYYQDDAHGSFQCRLSLVGLAEELKGLQSLDAAFHVGPKKEAEAKEDQ